MLKLKLGRYFKLKLVVALLAMVITAAFLCFSFIQDRNEYANTTCLPLAKLKTGAKVQVFLIPQTPPEESSLHQFWSGTASSYKCIPFDSWKMDSGKLITNYKGIEKIYQVDELMFNSGVNASNAESWLKSQIKTKNFYWGTDTFGRDVFSRVMVGSRITLGIGIMAVIISLVIGTLLGSMAGYFGGVVDASIMWVANVVWSLPGMLLIIAITLAIGKGIWQVFIAIGITTWVDVARIVRGQILSIKQMDYIAAAKVSGLGSFRILFRHVLPNIWGIIFIYASSNFASAVLLEAGLSFLGMGAQPPIPTWGGMIKEAYSQITIGGAHMTLAPGLAIMFVVFLFSWLSYELRDLFDNKLVR